MTDEIWSREEVASPCKRVCVIHPVERICIGCFRTTREIADWSRLEPEERAEIMAALPAREPRLRKRRGGRGARLGQGRASQSDTPPASSGRK